MRRALVLAIAALAVLGMGGRVFRGSGGAGATFTAAFTAVPLQGATCVAPCAVHFDGSTSDSTSYTREFHELKYAWGFGDSAADSLSWWHTAETGVTRNEDFGPIVGHVYEAPGTYTATLTATAPNGETASTTRSVVIADPQTVFGDALTWCFADTAGTFQGCPLDDDSDGTCEAGESSYSTHCVVATDFDDALSSGGSVAGCDSNTQKARCLFKGGDTFTSSAMVTLFRSSAPGLVGTFGTGRALVTSTAQVQFDLRDGWQIAGFDWNTGTTDNSGFMMRVFPSVSIVGAGIYNSSITGKVSNCAQYNSGSTVPNDDVWLIASECDKDQDSTVSAPQFLVAMGSRNLFVGNTLHPNNRATQQLSARVLLSDSAFSHNDINGPGLDDSAGYRGVLQLRNDGTTGTDYPNTRNEVAYNKLAVRNGPAGAGLDWTKICAHHSGCGSTSAEGAACADVIYENNLHTIDGTPGQDVGYGVHVQCSDTTIRSNVFDLSGTAGVAGSPVAVGLFNLPSDVATDDRIQVYNNTVYVPGSEAGNFTMCANISNAGSEHECNANLAYLPGQTGTRAPTYGTGWETPSPANDLRTTPIPSWWPATPAAQGLTNYLDFVGNELTCTITGATQVGVERGCILRDPLIGMNVENGAKYTEVLPHTGATITNFKDVFKNSALNRGDGTSGLVWESYEASSPTVRRDDHTLALDANGWPSASFPYDPDGGGSIPNLVARTKIARSAYLPAGTYELSFTGTGTVHVEGAVPTADCTGAAEPCSMTLTPSWDGITLWITSGTVSDIHFVPSAYVATYAAAPLHPDLVAYYDDFEGFRAMDWTRTNHHPCDTGSNAGGDCVTSWASRTTTTDQQNTTKGMAWEYVALLANEADVNPWINVPHGADDAYVTALATLLHDDLETDKTLTIELSNETWNSIFGQYTYFLALANARGYTGTDAQKRRKAIVARLAEVTALFRAAWGEDAHRIIPVMGIQGVAADATEMMTYWDSATYNPTGETLAALAFPLYATDSGQVSDGFSAGDITTTFSELDSYLSGTILPGLQALEAVASANNLQLFATEGGTLLDGATADANDELAAINADARMGVFIEDLLDTFRTSGGDRFMAFNAAAWSSYVAAEGYVEYLGQTPTPSRYQALLDKITEWAAP